MNIPKTPKPESCEACGLCPKDRGKIAFSVTWNAWLCLRCHFTDNPMSQRSDYARPRVAL